MRRAAAGGIMGVVKGLEPALREAGKEESAWRTSSADAFAPTCATR